MFSMLLSSVILKVRCRTKDMISTHASPPPPSARYRSCKLRALAAAAPALSRTDLLKLLNRHHLVE